MSRVWLQHGFPASEQDIFSKLWQNYYLLGFASTIEISVIGKKLTKL